MNQTADAILRARQRGVTLIEAVLYIAVALALIVGGLVFYQQASTASRMNSLVTILTSLMAETRVVGFEGSNENIGVDFNGYLVTRGSVPDAWLDRSKPVNEQIRHPWGGFVQLEPTSIIGPGGRVFEIIVRISDLPLQVCARLGSNTIKGTSNMTTVYSGGLQGGVAYDTTPFLGQIAGGTSIENAFIACFLGDENRDGKVSLQQRFLFNA